MCTIVGASIRTEIERMKKKLNFLSSWMSIECVLSQHCWVFICVGKRAANINMYWDKNGKKMMISLKDKIQNEPQNLLINFSSITVKGNSFIFLWHYKQPIEYKRILQNYLNVYSVWQHIYFNGQKSPSKLQWMQFFFISNIQGTRVPLSFHFPNE